MAKGDDRQCKRCGHRWTQRVSGTPRRCTNPDCRSPYWQTEAYHTRHRPDVFEITVADIEAGFVELVSP